MFVLVAFLDVGVDVDSNGESGVDVNADGMLVAMLISLIGVDDDLSDGCC